MPVRIANWNGRDVKVRVTGVVPLIMMVVSVMISSSEQGLCHALVSSNSSCSYRNIRLAYCFVFSRAVPYESREKMSKNLQENPYGPRGDGVISMEESAADRNGLSGSWLQEQDGQKEEACQ